MKKEGGFPRIQFIVSGSGCRIASGLVGGEPPFQQGFLCSNVGWNEKKRWFSLIPFVMPGFGFRGSGLS